MTQDGLDFRQMRAMSDDEITTMLDDYRHIVISDFVPMFLYAELSRRNADRVTRAAVRLAWANTAAVALALVVAVVALFLN